ncbi:MAG: UDP-3-O-(3-hydroxymyristoyl)glucosamine N-acyltransferase [Phycisphaerales bacterium]|nr:UDP-3-O-(3-hydroxymyristoyl)glucosamine N-acyltransferase [Phycisphaerales bacterium]
MYVSTLTTGQIAQLVDAELFGPADLLISRPATLDDAQPGDICFIRSPDYAGRWPTCRASAALVSRGIDVPGHDAAHRALLVVPDADLALAQLLAQIEVQGPAEQPGVHPTAVVSPAAEVSAQAHVGPHCVIAPGARIDAGAALMSHVSIGAGAAVGAGSMLHPGVVIYARSIIGARVVIHANTVIGADGFGYLPPGGAGAGPVKVPHLGNVVIGDDVEIGAGVCIDRAKFGSTTVGPHTKIDNLVQVGHNCSIGRCCVICGHTGIAGSVRIGDYVTIGGKVGFADNISVGDGASIGGGSLVHSDVPAGETWIGVPAGPAREAMARHAAFRNLPEIARNVKKLLRAQEKSS